MDNSKKKNLKNKKCFKEIVKDFFQHLFTSLSLKPLSKLSNNTNGIMLVRFKKNKN